VSSGEDNNRLWDGDKMLGPYGELNPEQVAAVVDRAQPLVLEASAGAGKTLVLVERFVRDVLEQDGDNEPLACEQILAITFTKKAAAELRERIRRRLSAIGVGDDPLAPRARVALSELDGAWISTIDSFCARLLRRHALLAGVDPAFEVVEEADLAALRERAFRAATVDLLDSADRDQAIELLASEGSDRFGKQQVSAEIERLYDQMRSAGEEFPCLPEISSEEDPRGWVALLSKFLVAYGQHFEATKRASNGCDFSDVVFAARNLLRDNEALADEYRERFKRVLIDEFQDTNGLQLDLFDALGVQSRFQVGDPLQSIYGFRFADLEIFRKVAAAYDEIGRKFNLTRNYRSDPSILETINAAFNQSHTISDLEWVAIEAPEGAKTLVPGQPLVELLFTDSVAWKGQELTPIEAEARLVASRIRRLLDEHQDDDQVGPGNVVVLIGARTHMALYRDELARLGIDAVADGGERWWERQELSDLLCHLRLLANTKDDAQLLHSLRSPICGIGVETLVLLGAIHENEGVGSIFEAFQQACSEDQLDDFDAAVGVDERTLLRTYQGRFADWNRFIGQGRVGALIDKIAADSLYEEILLSHSGGDQKLANLRQLSAIAHSWDRRHGGSLRDFLEWADKAAEAKRGETDAPVGGALDVDGKPDPQGPVRLMTIHAAKGLEFPFVVVPRLGSGEPNGDALVRVEGDLVACSLKSAGMEGKKGVIGPFDELLERAKEKQHYESRRMIHVGMTRAERLLILSGEAKPSGPWSEETIECKAGSLTWMVPGLLGTTATELLNQDGDQVVTVEGDGHEGKLKLIVSRPDRSDELFEQPREEDSLGSNRDSPVGAVSPPTGGGSAPSVPPTISYSQLSRFDECGYRWYLERVVGLPQREGDGYADDSRGARARGTLTHRLLETLTFKEPEEIPSLDSIEALARGVDGAMSDRSSLVEQQQMLEVFVACDLWRELEEAEKVEKESNFALEIVSKDQTLPVLIGTIDVLAELGSGRFLVVDYKTDRVGANEDLAVKVENRYSLQRDAYALSALRRGASEVEVVYSFLERPDERVSVIFEASQEPQIVSRLEAAARKLTGSEFPVSDRPHSGLCTGCPGRSVKNAAGLCSHSEGETSRK
jgi:ATP-dependent exoDNAse (exonuclease V) beta subunit